MAISWQILDVKSQVADGLVTNVIYACLAQLDNYVDRRVGEVALEGSTDTEGFIPYSELTEAQIIQWVKSTLGSTVVNETETSMSNSVLAQKAAVESRTIKSGLPWKD
jgi:hypothetical protein